jgi:hypothetical protein
MPEKTSNPIGDPDRSTIRDSSHTGRMADGTTAPGTDEAVLLQRIRQGDQSAMAEVFDRYGRAVYSVALRILKDTGHAEDVMQEIFFPGCVAGGSGKESVDRSVAAQKARGFCRRRDSGFPRQPGFRSRAQLDDGEGPESFAGPSCGAAKVDGIGIFRGFEPFGDRGENRRSAGHS